MDTSKCTDEETGYPELKGCDKYSMTGRYIHVECEPHDPRGIFEMIDVD
jgi:hypothetical protein